MEETPAAPAPKTFDKCPACGSTKRVDDADPQPMIGLVMKMEADDAIMKRALLSLDGSVKIKHKQLQLAACGDCGALYCARYEVIDVPGQVQMQRPVPAPRTNPFGRQ